MHGVIGNVKSNEFFFITGKMWDWSDSSKTVGLDLLEAIETSASPLVSCTRHAQELAARITFLSMLQVEILDMLCTTTPCTSLSSKDCQG